MLAPVIVIGFNSLILAVPANSPYKTVGQIVAAAKADPGALSFASPGIGGTSHLAGELFQKLAGIKLVHVPNARSPAYADVIAGMWQCSSKDPWPCFRTSKAGS